MSMIQAIMLGFGIVAALFALINLMIFLTDRDAYLAFWKRKSDRLAGWLLKFTTSKEKYHKNTFDYVKIVDALQRLNRKINKKQYKAVIRAEKRLANLGNFEDIRELERSYKRLKELKSNVHGYITSLQLFAICRWQCDLNMDDFQEIINTLNELGAIRTQKDSYETYGIHYILSAS